MRKAAGICAILVSCELAAPTAQSLADLAQEAQARRKHVAPGKHYTNADLDPVEPAEAPATTRVTDPSEPGEPAGVRAAADVVASDTAADTTPPARAREKRDEAYWRGRSHTLRSGLQRVRDDVEMLQARVEAIGTGSVSPALARERDVVRASLTEQRRRLQALTTEMDALQKEARERNVPPGWLD